MLFPGLIFPVYAGWGGDEDDENGLAEIQSYRHSDASSDKYTDGWSYI